MLLGGIVMGDVLALGSVNWRVLWGELWLEVVAVDSDDEIMIIIIMIINFYC